MGVWSKYESNGVLAADHSNNPALSILIRSMKHCPAINDLLNVMARLRAPEGLSLGPRAGPHDAALACGRGGL